jgi:hypothetical protein
VTPPRIHVDARLARLGIDKQEVAEAAALLGVTRPIRIEPCPANYRRYGDFQSMGSFYRIRLHPHQTGVQASRTIWHELAHAMQTSDSGRLWARGAREGAYRDRPIEVEARAIEAEYAPHLPLTRAAAAAPESAR